MIAYAQIVDKQTKLVVIGAGTDNDYYKSIGMTQMDVEQAYNGAWYLKGYVPSKPEPTNAEKVQVLERETGLTRAVRELVLAAGSGASDYVRAKAQEIEALANPLRGAQDVSAPAEPHKEEAQ